MKELSELLSLNDGQVREFLTAAAAAASSAENVKASATKGSSVGSGGSSDAESPVKSAAVLVGDIASGASLPISKPSSTATTAGNSSSESSDSSTTQSVISKDGAGSALAGASIMGDSDAKSRFHQLANSLKVTWVSKQQVW